MCVVSVPVLKSASFVLVIFHFSSSKNMQIKLFLSPTTLNSCIGPSGEYDGPTFCVKAMSKVLRRGSFKTCLKLCVASAGSKLVFFLLWKRNLTDFSVTVVFSIFFGILHCTQFCNNQDNVSLFWMGKAMGVIRKK